MKFGPLLKSSKGFTLVELLVVIGILGILIVALIAALDPLEQIRRGTDSSRKTAARDLQSAVTRFYTVNGKFPWSTTNALPSCYGSDPLPGAVNVTDTGFTTCLTTNVATTNLVDSGELKGDFINLPSLKKSNGTGALYINQISGSGGATQIAVCFDPESRGESLNALTKYQSTGALAAAGTCNAVTNTCYFCVQ